MNKNLGHKQYFAFLIITILIVAAYTYWQDWQYAITSLGYMAIGWNIGSVILRIIYWEKFD